jgi:Mrp family chromosome partitioning ATPase
MEQTIVSTLSQEALKDSSRMPSSRLREAEKFTWADLAPLKFDPDTILRNRIVTANRSDPAHVAFDMMRTKLLQSMRQNNWTSVAITSPTPGCGKTFTALNLAFSLANQQDCKTLLLDLPPMLAADDVLAFLPNVDCVILVAAAEQSTLSDVDVCEQTLAEKTDVLGVVLNKCKFSAERYGY